MAGLRLGEWLRKLYNIINHTIRNRQITEQKMVKGRKFIYLVPQNQTQPQWQQTLRAIAPILTQAIA